MADKNQQAPDQQNDATPADNGGQDDVLNLTPSQLAARLERKERAVMNSLLEELGFESQEQLQEEIEAARKRREEEMSELEKAQKRTEELERRVAETQQTAQRTALEAEFKMAATQLGATHPGNAIKLVDNVDQFLDNGHVVGVEEAVRDLIETGQLPTSKRAAPSVDGGAGARQRPESEGVEELTDAELRIARRMGISPEDYVKYKE